MCQASKTTPGTHSDCLGALCFCCGALCKFPTQIYIFLQEDLIARGKLLCPFKNKIQALLFFILLFKPLDPFGKQYCPWPTLRVSQLIYKTTNLCKFRLNRSSESRENNGKTYPCIRTFRHVMTCV